jgi:hypothetical protein
MSALVKVNFRVQGSIGLKARKLGDWEAGRLGGWEAGSLKAFQLYSFIAL